MDRTDALRSQQEIAQWRPGKPVGAQHDLDLEHPTVGQQFRVPPTPRRDQPYHLPMDTTLPTVYDGGWRGEGGEELLDQVETRHHDGRVDLGPRTSPGRSCSTFPTTDPDDLRLNPGVRGHVRDCPALRTPGTPTDQAWIESLNGHVKAVYPHLLDIDAGPPCGLSWRSPGRTTTGVWLPAGVGSVTPDDETRRARRSPQGP